MRFLKVKRKQEQKEMWKIQSNPPLSYFCLSALIVKLQFRQFGTVQLDWRQQGWRVLDKHGSMVKEEHNLIIIPKLTKNKSDAIAYFETGTLLAKHGSKILMVLAIWLFKMSPFLWSLSSDFLHGEWMDLQWLVHQKYVTRTVYGACTRGYMRNTPLFLSHQVYSSFSFTRCCSFGWASEVLETTNCLNNLSMTTQCVRRSEGA